MRSRHGPSFSPHEGLTDDVIRAYEEQLEFVDGSGGRIILMASRALATANSPDDYRQVYGRILRQTKEPVILHWLGEMFDPALAGYWGSGDDMAAMGYLCRPDPRPRGESEWDEDLSTFGGERNRHAPSYPPGCSHVHGRRFNYAELIAGDEQGHSDALLGIFDAIAPAASVALAEVGGGDEAGIHAVLAPTVPLSRHIFTAPTGFYKTGMVFLGYLNGFQDHFVMLGGQQSARSLVHLAELSGLRNGWHAARSELAAARMRQTLALGGMA